MKTQSLFEIFNIKPTQAEFELVICENPKNSYKEAKQLLSSKLNVNFNDVNLQITRFTENAKEINTRFIDPSNSESIRGMSLHRVYIEKNISEVEYLVNSLIMPCLQLTGGKIIYVE